jgi:transcriptional/translational regulatory protein YebC/TACO1
VDESVCAEGFGPGGCALLVTARRQDPALRDAAREALHRHGGRAGAENSVAYLFHPVGVLRYPPAGKLPARALDAGAEDVRPLGAGDIEVITDPTEWPRIRDVLGRRGHVMRGGGVVWRAAGRVPLDAGQSERLQALMTDLRALEGVAQVYTNAAIPEQFLAPL